MVDAELTTEIKSKLHERTGHVSVLYEDSIYVWGGYSETPWRSRRLHQFRYYSPSEVIRLDSFYGYWEVLTTTGDIPAAAAGSCALEYNSHMYVFGGFVHSITHSMNLLYRLNLKTMVWDLIKPMGLSPVPCDKLAGWVYNNNLYFFGGFGYLPEKVPETTSIHFYRDDSSYDSTRPRGWNNQLFCYNPSTNSWEYPAALGDGPSPRAGHAACIDDNGNVFIFGGRCVTRNNELHILHMATMKWISSNISVKINCYSNENYMEDYDYDNKQSPNVDQPEIRLNSVEYIQGNKPARRSWHSLTHIGNSRFMLFGGLDEQNNVRYDVWTLAFDGVNTVTWTELYMTEAWPRFWHKAEYIKSEQEVMVVGGHIIHVSPLNDAFSSPILIQNLQVQADSLLCFNFGPKSLVRLCLDTVVEHMHEYSDEELSRLPAQIAKVISLKYNQNF
ncbi:kelch domain-containing protein 2-like [Planococcus citri]|uniref:kelch domain-containing protein 2-like n=1 Tax=Planococcus citri TaxID=170843 RepID=UPI0031F7230F